MTKNMIYFFIVAFFLISGVASADSDYCTPTTGVITNIEHIGDWYNITITTDTCTKCYDIGGGIVVCYPCKMTMVPLPSPLISEEKKPIRLETQVFPIIFLIIPVFCLWYIFRGHREGTRNPIWGDLFVSGAGFVMSAVVVLWFIGGGFTSVPVILEKISYEIPREMPFEDVVLVQENISRITPIIGDRGSGMIISSAISASNTSNPMVITVQTHDSVIQQYSDFGAAFIYAMFSLILLTMFMFSVSEFIVNMREQRV